MTQIKLQELRGLAFQDFVATVCELAYPHDFVRVRPAGSIGDKKCDGYLKSKKRVYAAYAPRSMVPATLKAKIQEDFDGARKNWPEMKEWYFVHNDTDGLDAGSLDLLLDLEKNSDVVITLLGPLDLKTLVMDLSDEALLHLFGAAADTRAMVRYSYPEIAAVVDSVLSIELPDGEGSLIPPSPEKLRHNGLGNDVTALLSQGEVKAPVFRQFFAERPKEMQGENVANWFRSRYRSLEAQGLEPTHIFHQLVSDAGGLNRPVKEQAAVLGLLSYLFHSCDIFRDVNADHDSANEAPAR
jgi:hypothetical protein